MGHCKTKQNHYEISIVVARVVCSCTTTSQHKIGDTWTDEKLNFYMNIAIYILL